MSSPLAGDLFGKVGLELFELSEKSKPESSSGKPLRLSSPLTGDLFGKVGLKLFELSDQMQTKKLLWKNTKIVEPPCGGLIRESWAGALLAL